MLSQRHQKKKRISPDHPTLTVYANQKLLSWNENPTLPVYANKIIIIVARQD
jgi:hypothetical protein